MRAVWHSRHLIKVSYSYCELFQKSKWSRWWFCLKWRQCEWRKVAGFKRSGIERIWLWIRWGWGEKRKRELEREESVRERRRRHERSRREGYQGDAGPIKVLSVRWGVITGEDVQRKDKNKKEDLAFDEGKSHVFIQHCLWSTCYIRQQSTKQDVLVIACFGWVFALRVGAC